MENRDTAQFTASPFRFVFGKLWVDRFEKRTHERDFELGAHDGALIPDVLDCGSSNAGQLPNHKTR